MTFEQEVAKLLIIIGKCLWAKVTIPVARRQTLTAVRCLWTKADHAIMRKAMMMTTMIITITMMMMTMTKTTIIIYKKVTSVMMMIIIIMITIIITTTTIIIMDSIWRLDSHWTGKRHATASI